VANAMQRVEVPWRNLCPSWDNDGDVVDNAFFFLRCIIRLVLFTLCGLSSLGKNLDLWLGDGGTSGVMF